MEIRFTRERDIPQLKDMWVRVFDPDNIYTDLFMKYRYPSCEAVGMFDCDRLLSVLYIMEESFKVKDRDYSLGYIFAVATLPEERKKGYSSEVIKFTHEYLKNKGIDCAALVPAEYDLYPFYERLDYETMFYTNFETFHIIKSKKLKTEFVDIVKLKDLRRKTMSQIDGFLDWCDEGLSFCQMDNACGGYGESISFPEIGDNYAVCEFHGDYILIKELVCRKKDRRRIINAVGNHYEVKKVIARDVPVDKSHPFGMIYPLSDKFKEEFDKNGLYNISLPMD